MHARIPTSPSTPVASWYTEGHSDGIGDRLLMFDNSGTPSLELLRFRPEFTSAHAFEPALREGVDRLRAFVHPAFPEIRGVEHLEGTSDLTLISTFTPGKRLVEVLRSPRAAWHPSFATWLIRELTPALADLHEQGHEVAHGALTPDRIILTPEGRLVIIEHVLVSALESVGKSTGRLWQPYGVTVPGGEADPALLNRRTDVVQLGLIALSVLLGRRISSNEYPSRVDALLEEFVTTTTMRSPGLVEPLRRWLENALRVDGAAFTSAIEARDGLGDLNDTRGGASAPTSAYLPRPGQVPQLGPGEPGGEDGLGATETVASDAVLVLESALAWETPLTENPESHMRNSAPAPADRATHTDEPAIQPVADTENAHSLDSFNPEPPSAKIERPATSRPLTPGVPVVAASPTPIPAASHVPVVPIVQTIPGSVVPPAPIAAKGVVEAPRPKPPTAQAVPAKSAVRSRLVIGLASIAVIEAVVIGALVMKKVVAPPPAATAITVESLEPGDAVIVDGRAVGVTPMTVQLGKDTKSLQVIKSREAAPEVTTAAAAAAAVPPVADKPAPASTALADAAARQRSGGLRVTSPIDIQVFDGDRILGSSADGPVVTTAGRRQLDFVNNAFGYRSRQQVEIKAGQIISMTITPQPGRVSVNAVPWAQVSIDGTSVGDTPLANLSLAVGEHQITFRHPQFGERTEKVIVRSGVLTRVSATFGQ